MKGSILKVLTELRPEFNFTESINFIEAGMLDSFDIVSLVDSIENQFGVSISGEDILPENFCSIEAIESLINKSRN